MLIAKSSFCFCKSFLPHIAIHICQPPLVNQLPTSEKRQRSVYPITVIKGGSVYIGIRFRVYRASESVLSVYLCTYRRQKRGYGGLMFSLVCIIGIKLLLYLRTVLHCIAHAIVQTPYFILRHYRGCQSKRKYCCKYNSFHCYIIFYLIKCKERAKTVKTLYHNMLTNFSTFTKCQKS